MLQNLPGKVLPRKGTAVSNILVYFPKFPTRFFTFLMVAATTTGFLGSTAEGQSLAVGVVFSGFCDGGEHNLISDTADAVRQDYPAVTFNYRLVTVCGDSLDEETEALNETYSQSISNPGLDSVIVMSRPQFCHLPFLYAADSSKVTVSPNCPTPRPTMTGDFSMANKHFVISLQSSVTSASIALDMLLRRYQWQSLNFVVSVESRWLQFAQAVSLKLSLNGYTVKTFQGVSPGASSRDLVGTFTAVGTDSKVVILFMDVMLTYEMMIARQSPSARNMPRDLVFISVVETPYALPVWLYPISNLSDIHLQNLFVLSPSYNDAEFNKTYNLTGRPNSDATYSVSDASVGIDVGIYDAFLLLLQAAKRSLDNGMSLGNSMHLFSNIVNMSISSPFTDVKIDSTGDTFCSYAVLAFSASNSYFQKTFRLSLTAEPSDLELIVIQGVDWINGIPAPDPCYLRDWTCYVPQSENKAELTLYILLGLVGAAVIALFVMYMVRRYLERKQMEKGPNKLLLTSPDIVFVHRKHMKGSSKTLAKSTMFEKPDILKASEPSYSMTSLNEYVDFSETARYNGDLVHVKEIRVKGFEMKGKLMSYLRMLRELRHENLNPFVGFLNESTRPAVVTEFCTRGSLEDVIQNEDIKLDWDFKLSLLTDLVRGLRYIHSGHLKHHGFLKSRNCVIDSRWVLKITDYGMQGILSICKLSRDLEARDLLWTSPDLLRDPVMLQRGSEKGDVFSLAIIMQEVILRTSPYSTTGLTPEEIIQKVKKPPPLIRPSVSQQAAPPQYIQLMKQCWAEMPDMRPDVEQIYQQFKAFNHGKKMNIVDTMFKMLEKYSSDLEEIVQNRTTQLEEEKKKTDQLLFRMLPASVAESLKTGTPVEAETFSEVTIYFSDIVGFTTISAMSTPLQVVDLLNDLYTMFDATIDMYDVYKVIDLKPSSYLEVSMNQSYSRKLAIDAVVMEPMGIKPQCFPLHNLFPERNKTLPNLGKHYRIPDVETIGDAYMVVSGLPTRNGNRHAGEVGTMALDLLSQCGTFVIRHMPEVPLRLRIGLHTGPCVAGVVGLTMPRYCLFGDTVNTASRMESSGGAFRVHLSQKTKDKLDELKGYHTTYRGEVELKGKGMHKTYWLTGKDGFDKPLPEPPDIGLASVIDTGKGSDTKSKSKANLADLVGALNTIRKAAINRTSNAKSDETTAKVIKVVPEKNAVASSRPSTEGQVSLTPITLEERDTPPSPPVELSPLREL